MGLSVRVDLVRGIDYGPRPQGLDVESHIAWGWWDESDDDVRGAGGCNADVPNGGDDAAAHLVVYARPSRVRVWAQHGGEVPPVVDVLGATGTEAMAMAQAHDDALRAYCVANKLPWRAPRWLVTVDQS